MLKVCAGFAGTTTKVYALGNGQSDFYKKFTNIDVMLFPWPWEPCILTNTGLSYFIID